MTLHRHLPPIGLRIGLVVLIAGAVTWATSNRGIDPATFDAWLSDWGIWAPLLYLGLYVIATAAFVPGSLFALAGGAVRGRSGRPFSIPARPQSAPARSSRSPVLMIAVKALFHSVLSGATGRPDVWMRKVGDGTETAVAEALMRGLGTA